MHCLFYKREDYFSESSNKTIYFLIEINYACNFEFPF